MENNENFNSELENSYEEKELTHSDKIIGIFSEPSNTFSQIAKFPARTIDWLVPILILMILAGGLRSLVLTNKEVMYEAKKKQIENFDKMVKEGKMTQEEADKAIENTEKSIEFMSGPAGIVINITSSVIFGFMYFFIISGIYFLLIRFVLRGEGTYQQALVSNGLTSYISMIQVIITGILTFIFGKIISDTSVASFIEVESGTLLRFFLAKIDPIAIWAYSVLAIGLAKLNKAENARPYFILVFAVWFLGGLLFFYLGKVSPFLSGFGG
jgi:hypothetical protein